MERARFETTVGSRSSAAARPGPKILTHVEPMQGAIDAYETFDRRESGWIKVELKV